jgi:hypothetical protein
MEPTVNMRVLIANEPPIYREVLSATLRELRPQIEVVTVEPSEVDHATVHLSPNLVVCSMLTETVETRSSAWIVLYPEGAAWALISVDGERRAVDGADFYLLLAIVDQIEDPAQSA